MSESPDLHDDDRETPTQAAVRFARAGMKVFPVDMRPDENGQPRKRPPYWYLWKQRATAELAEVVEDFTDAEHDLGIEFVGVAWALGQDGCVAPDLDGAEPEWWPQLGETAVNVTKRGEHLIFRQPPGRRVGNGTSKFPTQGWGEVRGDGGYIVIWWSDRPGFDVAELERIAPFPRPEWLTDAGDDADVVTPAQLAAFKAAHTTGRLGPIKGFETLLAARAPGVSRHVHATVVAPWIAREAAAGVVPATEAFAVLEDWWAEVAKAVERDTEGRVKTRRLTPRELQAIERWAVGLLTPERVEEVRAKAAAGDADWLAEQQAEQDAYRAMFGTASAATDNLDADDDGFCEVDLGPWIRGEVQRPAPDFAAMNDGRCLLYRTRLNLIFGDSGAGKSWLLAFTVDQEIRAGRVVMVIDTEDDAGALIDRLKQIGTPDDEVLRLVSFMHPNGSFKKRRNVDRIIEIIRRRGVVHVLLDSWGEAFALDDIDENADVQVAPWLHRVVRRVIDETGVGITLIDHGTKAAERPLHPSGSKRKRAAVTGSAWLLPGTGPFDRENGGRTVVRCAKDKHGFYRTGDDVAELVMGSLDLTGHSTLDLVALTPAPASSVRVDLMVVAVNICAAAPTKEMTKGAIRAAARQAGTKFKNADLDGAVDLAVVRGFLKPFRGYNGASAVKFVKAIPPK